MPTPRSAAQDEGYHYLLEVWPSAHHRQIGAESLRVSTGLLSSKGAIVTFSGRTFPPGLDPGARVTRYFSTVSPSYTARIIWDRDTQDPANLDLRDAVGDLWEANETTSGTAIGAARLLISGRVTAYQWGDEYEALSITLSGRPLIDKGDWYTEDAELTTDRFADIGNTGDRDRAPACKGMLPPLTWAPVGSQMFVPAYTVVDEDDAVSGVSDLVPRRHLLGYRKPTNISQTEQMALENSDSSSGWLDSTNSTEQQKIPASATDLQGDTYWYVSGDFEFTIGSTTVTITAASADFTATRVPARQLREGYQLKATGDTSTRYTRVEAFDRPTGRFVAVYPAAAAGVVNGTGVAVPLPEDSADACRWIPARGGIDRGDGTPLTISTEVLIDWLRLCNFDMPLAYGDLSAMTGRLGHVTISYCRRERGSPWAKCLEVLAYLPIRPYVADGMLRFRWVGPPTPEDIVATIDPTNIGAGVYRSAPFRWADDEPSPLIDLKLHYDAHRETYRAKSSINADSTIGRAKECIAAVPRPGRVLMELDTIESLSGLPRLVAMWILYGVGHARRVIELDIDSTWRWLELGDVVLVSSRCYRVEAIGFDATGSGTLLLEECPV